MCEDEKLTGFVKNVADAIREVEGSSDQIRPVDFPERIKNLSSSSSSGFVYNVNTVNETSVPTADLEKLKSDPNAMIIETYTIAPVNFKIYYRKMFKSGDTYDRFVSVYSTANEEHINQTTLRAYRDLNYATSTLSKKRTVNIVNEDQLAAYLRRPTDNPTQDSVVKVSSTGSTSWIAISDIKVPIIEIPAASTTITQEQANIIINNKDVTILYGTTQKIIYRKFTEYELTTTHLAYFVQFGGANPDAAQKIKQLVLTVDLNNLTVSRVELEIPRVSFITGTDEDENDVVLQTKFAKEVFDTPAVKANPTLKGTEEELTALQVGLTKYKVPSGGGSGAGIDTLTDVNLTSSGTTVAYDIASGVTVSSNGKFTYEGGEKDATTKVNVPIVAGKGIVIDKVADKEQVEAKVDIADAVSMNDASHRGNIYIPFKQGTNDYSIGIGSKPTSDDNSGIQIGSSSFARQKGVAVGGYAKCGCVGVAIGFSIENKYNSSNPSEQNGKVTVGAYLTNDTDGCIVLGTGNEKTTAEDRFILADGNGYNLNQRHTYFKIIKETVDNVAKYTAYLNNKKLLTEDEGLAKPSGNPTEDSVVKVSSTGTVSYLGIDTTATSASANLVTSGAVAAVESSLSQRIAGCATEPDISTFPENDDAFFIGEKISHASKWLPKKHMTLKSHKIHFEAFDSGSTVGQYDDAFISVLCYTETPFTVDTLTIFMLATGQSYPVCSPSYGMVGYVRVSNAAGEITWEDKEGNNIALAGINKNSYVVIDIQSFFPFE